MALRHKEGRNGWAPSTRGPAKLSEPGTDDLEEHMLDHMTGHNKTSLRSDIAVFVFPSFHPLTSRQRLIWYTDLRLFVPHVYQDDKRAITTFERTT